MGAHSVSCLIDRIRAAEDSDHRARDDLTDCPGATLDPDAAEAVTAGLTAWLIRRRSPVAGVTSAMVGTLLLADAWFDVCTSARGLQQFIAVLPAALLEIPLSCAALWFAAVTIRSAAQAGSSAGTTAGG